MERLGKGLLRRGTKVIIGILLLLPLLSCLSKEGPLPGHPGARLILPADKAEWVSVLPDGRRILFNPGFGYFLTLLDVGTGNEIPISKEIATAGWFDDELVYGFGYGEKHFVVDLRLFSVIKLESLPPGSPALPRHIREADAVYVLGNGAILLLLEREPSGTVTGGYAAMNVRNLDMLLAGIPYKVPPSFGDPNSGQEEHPSPDGRYYYTCKHTVPDEVLRIYSQQGDLLNFVSVSNTLTCYGWAWDNSGVYFRESVTPMIGPARFSPLQLLPVRP